MICLVRPPAAECFRFATTSPTLPLGLAYIAAALEETGEPVHVIDAIGEAPTRRTRYITGYLIGLPLDEIAARIPDEARVVGITVGFTHEWPAIVRLVDLIKARRPELPIVLGGEHVTSMPEFCLLTSKADVLVLGEGEETVVELMQALRTGGALATIDGLVFRAGDRIVVNRRRARRRDVDAIAWPAWHHFKVATYHENRLVGGIYSKAITIPILATRGCPYQCTYCSAPNMWEPLWIPRDPKNVVDEIQTWLERYDARHFQFHDLTAIIRKDWIVAFCTELLARKLDVSWQLPVGTRSEAIDGEVAELLKRSNMTNMAYAPESGSETTRRLIKKKMHTERLFTSIKHAVDADLSVSMYMVLGLPHDTRAHIAENLPFVDRLVANGVADISFSFYMALPGTELFNSLYDAGKLRLDRAYFAHTLHNLALVPVRSYSDHLTRAELTAWKLRLFARFYGGKRSVASGKGLGRSVGRALQGFGDGSHQSKLESAVRNAGTTLANTLLAQLKPGWMSRRAEKRLFDGWDETFREIRRRKIAEGVIEPAPADTALLYKENAVVALKREHDTPRTLPARFDVATRDHVSGRAQDFLPVAHGERRAAAGEAGAAKRAGG